MATTSNTSGNILGSAFMQYGLGTGSKPNVPAADVKSPAAQYEYGQAGRTGRDTDGDGFREVDCSALVYNALRNAGYPMPGVVPTSGSINFTTNTLFNGDKLTSSATQNFDEVKGVNNFKPGDIMLFAPKGGAQHMGIYYGQDAAGNLLFYGSQTSTGPAVFSMVPPRIDKPAYFNTDNLIGVLRPKPELYVPEMDLTGGTGTGLSSSKVVAAVNLLKSSDVEGYKPNIYSDNASGKGDGVPTVGNGFALVVKGSNGWTVRPENEIKDLLRDAGLPESKYSELPMDKLQQSASLLNQGDKAGARAVFGVGDSDTGFSLSAAEADKLTASFVVREVIPRALSTVGGADKFAEFSDGEFAAVASKTYQNPGWLRSSAGKSFLEAWARRDDEAAQTALGSSGRGQAEAQAYAGNVQTTNSNLSATASDDLAQSSPSGHWEDTTQYDAMGNVTVTGERVWVGDAPANAPNTTPSTYTTSNPSSNALPQASYLNEGRSYPSIAGDAVDSELPDGTRMVSTSSTVNGQTTVNTQLLAKDGSVLLSAGSGQTMERDPETGIVSVRTEGSAQVRQYSPISGMVSDALKPTLTEDQADQLLQDLGLKKAPPDGPALVIAASGDGVMTDGGAVTGYAEGQASNQAAAGTQCAQPAIKPESSPGSFTAYLQGQGSELSPAQQNALAIQLDGLNLGGAADLSFHSLPGGGVLISNADGDIVGEINRSANGDINLRANSITRDGDASQTSTHITSSGETFNDSQYTEAQLRGVTQGLGLVNSLVGLQHWAHMSDLGKLSAVANLYNQIDRLGMTSAGDSGNLLGDLGGAAAALSLMGNIERGNLGGTVVSAIALGDALGQETSKAIASALGLNAAAAANVIPGISLALALESGNPVSMLAAAANFIPGYGPLISIGLSLFGSGGGLFGGSATPPPPYGEVHFAWSGFDANGQPHTATRTDANVSGGAAMASQIAGQLLGSLQTMVEQANARTLHDHPDTDPSQLLALNTNLLPSVFWDKDQTSLKLPNPDGVTSFFVNLAEPDAMSQVVQLLQSNGGIAPKWLVDTQSQRYAQLLSEGAGDVAIERELTAGKSGLTEQGWSQAAAIQGSAGEAADFKTQQFGSLIVHAQDAQVQLTEALKNIDADAYLERTEWVAANDALGHAQSLLVIDFNADGVIDTRDVLNLGGNRGQTDARDAQMLNANADLQRNNVQWLDANGDGVLDARDPAFAAVRLFMDINADARVQDGEARSLAQAGITAIDFTAGQVRYADGHSDALTAQLLTGDTSGVRLTKVYEVVDGQHIDLQAGDVLEHEGYQGQDAVGAIRQQTFEHEAVRTGDWEGTAEQDAHRHGGGNVDGAPTQTTATVATSQGEVKTQANVTTQRNVSAAEVKQATQQTTERVVFVPLGAGLGMGVGIQTRDVTADMVQTLQDGALDGLGGMNLAALAALAMGSTQAAAEVVNQAAVNQVVSSVQGLAPASGAEVSAQATPAVMQAVPAPAPSGVQTTPAQAMQGSSMSGTGDAGSGMNAGNGTGWATVPGTTQASGGASQQASPAAGEFVASTGLQSVAGLEPLQAERQATQGEGGGVPGEHNSTAGAGSTSSASNPASTATTTLLIDYPTVQGERIASDEDVVLRIPGAILVANDSTPNAAADPGQPALRVSAVGEAAHGQVSMVGDTVVFTPERNYNGSEAGFTYTVADQYGLSRTARVALNLAPVNDAPDVLGGEEVDGTEDEQLTIAAAGLLANDSDVDNPHADLVLSRVQADANTHGTVGLDANGDVVFTPEANYNGDATFTYWVKDSAGADSAGATATVRLAAVNDAPGAQSETLNGASEDAAFLISATTLLANDHDIDNADGELSLAWVGDAQHGAVSLDANGNVVFTPDANYNGQTVFSYRVKDPAGLESPTVQASFDIAAVNDAPVAVDDRFSTYRNSTMSIGFAQLTGNDTDVENDALTVSEVRNGVNGEVALVNGKVQFVPTVGFTGAASFDYLADDGQGGQTWATAFVNVIIPPLYPTVNVTLGSYWIDVWHNDAANLRQTFNYSFNDENPATVTMDIVPNFGAGFTYAGYGNVQWVTAHDFNIFKYDRYGAANISLNLNLTDESGLTNVAHVYTTYHTAITVTSVFDSFSEVWNYSMSLDASLTSFNVWHDHTGYATPIVLNIDGKGVGYVDIAHAGMRFDFNGDGILDRSAGVAAGSGILGIDLDGDGQISGAQEFVFKQYVEGAQTDMQGLVAFDSNHDDVLDAKDAQWGQFGLWEDKNGDGQQTEGEYRTLQDLGVASISLQTNAQMSGLGTEALVMGQGSFAWADGREGMVDDVALAWQSGVDAALQKQAEQAQADAAAALAAQAELNRQALLFIQMCNAASDTDVAPLGFVPIEPDASLCDLSAATAANDASSQLARTA